MIEQVKKVSSVIEQVIQWSFRVISDRASEKRVISDRAGDTMELKGHQ